MFSRASARFSRAFAVRAAAHVVVWLPFVLALTRSVQAGWRPVSDNAGIALRSWDVLTAHGPLLGQATRLAHGVFDLGPLQYWLLTVPVHIDPVHGVLWGAALWCMLAASLTIEAAWSAAGMPGGLLAAAAVLGALAWIPEIAMLPCWNPWFGMMFFLAAIAACVAVLSGRRQWWILLVVAASIAAQAHLMFTITAAALVLLGLAVGLTETIRARAGYWWLVIGVIATLACWSAPLIQQFTTRTGNLTALSRGASVPVGGFAFGLKALAASAQPPTFWWRPEDTLLKLSLVEDRSAAAGAVVLVLAAVVLVAAYMLRSRRAVALAAVSATVTVTVLLMYAHIPVSSITMTTTTVDNLRYLMAPMYAVGVLSWLTAAVVLVLAARRVAVSRAQARAATGGDETAASAPRELAAPWTLRLAGLSAVAIIGLAVVAGVQIVDSDIFQHSAMRVVGAASQQIKRDVSSHRMVLFVVSPDNPTRRQVTFGLAYALRTFGYRPQIRKIWAQQLGPMYQFRGKPMPHVTVFTSDTSLTSVDVTKPLVGGTADPTARNACAEPCTGHS